MVWPPRDVYRFIIGLFVKKLLEAFDRSRMQPTGPTLRLADLSACLFQRLVLKVVPLEQFSLFFREFLDC
jgi:hypothetical protein